MSPISPRPSGRVWRATRGVETLNHGKDHAFRASPAGSTPPDSDDVSFQCEKCGLKILFTGLVSDVGTIIAADDIAAGRRFRLSSAYDPQTIAIGASIACNGVCHTVTARGSDDGNWFEIESAAETLAVTTVGGWQPGDRINLERSLAMGDELGGHLVLGHVDGTARIIERRDEKDSAYFAFEVPPECAPFIARKGSVAVDGTSLTVNSVTRTTFSVFLIPHTLEVTNWADRRTGDRVNIEVDMMARYLARLREFDGR